MDGLRELGVLVRRFRLEAGLSGAELARRAGVPQPSVSRAESGRRLADVAVVERLIFALGLDSEAASSLVAMAQQAYVEPATPRVDSGVSMVPGHYRRLAAGARQVRSFASAMIPIQLRTLEYMRAAAENRGQADDWHELARLLDDPDRSFTFVVTEGALRTWPGSVQVGDQLDRVLVVSERANVRLGVLPWRAVIPRLPLHDFTVFDAEAAWAETFTAELTVVRAGDVASCVAAFGAFERAAVYGDAARAVVELARADFTRIRQSLFTEQLE
jgi:transcriptional regulator with XRE-family HTH domain